MKVTRSLRCHSLFLMGIAFNAPLLSTAPHASKQLKALASQAELYHIAQQPRESYLYCDKHRSKIAQFIDEISSFDQDHNSPVWALKRHIAEDGFSIGRQDAIVEALAHAEKILSVAHKTLSTEQINNLQTTLSSIVDSISNGQLTVDVQSLLSQISTKNFSDDQAVFRSAVFKLREKFYALDSAKFFQDVEFKNFVEFKEKTKFEGNAKFKENVVIEGNFSSADATIGCDVTVGCNINMQESIDASIGNINKNGSSFIHNFGAGNTFIGENAGNFSMTGFANTSSGNSSLASNQNGTYNTACGVASLASNTMGSINTAHGGMTLVSNTSGEANTAVGFIAMASNTTGSGNTAVGIASLINNTIGGGNVAVGAGSLGANVAGSQNVALGEDALENSTGSNNIAIGSAAGAALASGNNNVYISNVGGSAAETGFIRIGTNGLHIDTYLQGIFGNTVGAGGLAVEVDSTGKLGTLVSSATRKHNINGMGNVSENIYRLRPVTFAFNDDATETEQYGLIAEEVADAFPSLVVLDNNGKPFAVRYQVLPMLLLNEVQKQNAMIQELSHRVAHLEQSAQ